MPKFYLRKETMMQIEGFLGKTLKEDPRKQFKRPLILKVPLHVKILV
jgi:hypothetical protein